MTDAVTALEFKVLRALLTNYFRDGQPPEEAWLWADCINDAGEPSGIEGKALSALVSSLNRKGLVLSSGSRREACIRMTPRGVAAAQPA